MFDYVNELNFQGENILLYPHQIKIIKSSEVKAEVVNSYFKGTYWLIELVLERQKIYLKHHQDIKIDSIVCLKIDKMAY